LKKRRPAAVAALAVGRRLHREDPHRVDLGAVVEAGVGALVVPVERHAVPVAREGVEAAPRVAVAAAGVGRGDAALGHRAVGVALALVEARSSDEAERRSRGEVLREPAVVREGLEAPRLLDAVDPLVRHHGARPALVVARVVLDEAHLRGLLDHAAAEDEVDAAVELRQDRVLVVDRARRVDGEEVVVRRGRGMRELADAR
jgi:hypothetical protein